MASTFTKRLNEAMQLRDLKQSDLVRITGISKPRISQYVNGVYEAKQQALYLLAGALNVNVAWLMGYDVPMEGDGPSPTIHPLSSAYPNIYDVDVQRVPMLGSVSCGVPKFANMEYESYTLKGTGIKCDFCLRASGDSMIGIGIHDGDIVFCRQQAMVDNGDVAVVAIGDEATLKRFYYYKEQCMLILRPENPAYPELVYSGSELDEVHVLGKAVASQMDVK